MKTNVNLFTSNLTGKALISEKKESRIAVKNALADYASTIEAEFNLVIKSTDRRARNVANAAKGKYHTALQVIVNCFPYQDENGVLCAKKTGEDLRDALVEYAIKFYAPHAFTWTDEEKALLGINK